MRSLLSPAWKGLKQFTLSAARGLGVEHAVSTSSWRGRRLLILCYHGISRSNEHLWRPRLFLRPDRFRERMDMIRRGGFRVLALAEGLQRLRDGTLPEKSLVLTFDDGEVGFYTHAFPVLQERCFPATVYLTSYYVEKHLPVCTIFLSYVLWAASGRNAAVTIPRIGRVELNTATSLTRERTHALLMNRTRALGLSSGETDDVTRQVAHALRVDYDALRNQRRLELMSPAEIRELAEHGVDFQLHTHRHQVPDDRSAFLREISDNRAVIERCAGSRPSHFCYPSGFYNDRVVGRLREAGIESAATCDPGLAARNTDPLLLPRLVDVPTLGPTEFQGWLAGPAAWLPRRRTVV